MAFPEFQSVDDSTRVVDIASLRERLLVWNAAMVAGGGLVALVAASWSTLAQGIVWSILPFWLLYALFVAFSLQRWLPFRVRVDGMLLLVWCAAGGTMVAYGEGGGLRAMLVLVVVLAAALRGIAGTVQWTAASLGLLLVGAVLRTQGFVDPPAPLPDERWVVWVALMAGLVLYTVPPAVTVALLLQRLDDGLALERSLVQRLRQEIDRSQAAARAGQAAVDSRDQAEAALSEREEALQAVAFAAQSLLHTLEWRTALPSILARLGRALRVVRVSLVRLDRADDGRVFAPTVEAWSADGYGVKVEVDMLEIGLGQVVEALIEGNAAPVYRRDLPEAGQHFFARFGAEALLVSPILGRDGSWGFLAAFKASPGPWAEATVEALAATAGAMSGALAAEAARQDLLELNVDLEERIAARTAGLQDANAELDAFAHSVSHDLRAPIRHVRGYAELLREHLGDGIDAESRRLIGVIENSSDRMFQMVDALLALSRVGRAEISPTVFPLGAAVADARGLLEPETRGRTIRWEIGGLPDVRADRVLLTQVLVNLLSNAVKYTSTRDEAHIAVRCVTTDREWRVTVTDDGVGFDGARVADAFAVFRRLHSEAEFPGAGVGLAVVRRIIVRHGGTVWAESTRGKGATVGFSLPRST